MNREAPPFIDPWVAVCVLLAIALVFMLGRQVPRRAPVIQVSPSEAKLDAIFVRFDAIEKRLAHCEHDGANVRTIVNTLPTKDIVHELSERVSAVSGQVNGMSAGLLANTQSLGRIEGFLIETAAETIVSLRKAGAPSPAPQDSEGRVG